MERIEGLTRMLGYADDWVILTSNKKPKTADTQLQKATNIVSRWAKEDGFTISKSHADLPKKA
jgi:hypothetical protein